MARCGSTCCARHSSILGTRTGRGPRTSLRSRACACPYLIRDARTREIVYIGESHTHRLFETMTRHLYVWNGRGSGPTYHPALVEIAVIVAETPLDDPVADQ